MTQLRFPLTSTLAGTALAVAGSTVWIAAPGAGTAIRLTGGMISMGAAGQARLEDTVGTEIFNVIVAGALTLPLTLPADGVLLTSARGLNVRSLTGSGTISGLLNYRLES